MASSKSDETAGSGTAQRSHIAATPTATVTHPAIDTQVDAAVQRATEKVYEQVGSVAVGLALGDDSLVNSSFVGDITSWEEQLRHCYKPPTCYTEKDIPNPININIGPKGWARVIFVVYNTSDIVIQHPAVYVMGITGQDALVKFSRADRRPGTGISLEFPPSENVDLVPFKTAMGAYDFPVDITVDNSVQEFSLGFRIFAEKLPNKVMRLQFHVVRQLQQ